MQIRDFYTHLLDPALPWAVKMVSAEDGSESVDVYLECPETARLPCPQCNRPCTVGDHSPSKTWRHLDTCGKKTFLHAKLPVVECPEHGKQHPHIPWAGGVVGPPSRVDASEPPLAFGGGGPLPDYSSAFHGGKTRCGLPVTTAFEKWLERLAEGFGDTKKAAHFAGVEHELLRRVLQRAVEQCGKAPGGAMRRAAPSRAGRAETAAVPGSGSGAGLGGSPPAEGHEAISQASAELQPGQLSLFARNDMTLVNRGIRAFSSLELEEAADLFRKHASLYPKGYDISSRLKAAEFLLQGMREAPTEPGGRPGYLCRLWDSFEEYVKSGGEESLPSSGRKPEPKVSIDFAFAARAKTAYFARVLQEVERAGLAGSTVLPEDIPIGFVLLQAGRYDEAIRSLQDCIPKMPHNAALYGRLGDAYLLRGDRIVARQCYREACFIDPGSIDWRHIEDADLKELKQDILLLYDFDLELALEWLPSHARVDGLFERKVVHLYDGMKEMVDDYLAMEKAWSKENSPRLAAKLFLRGMVLCENLENLKFIKKIDMVQVRRMMKQANPDLFEEFLERIVGGKG